MEHLLISDPAKQLVHVVLGIQVGWRHEALGERGLAHFLEHAVFLGNAAHPSPDEEVARYGVKFDGMTLPEQTLFFFTCAQGDLHRIYPVLASLVFQPVFVEDKVQKEKAQAVLTSVTSEPAANPWEHAHDLARDLLFDWEVMYSLGTRQEVQSFTGADLARWHRAYYHEANSFLLVHGAVREQELPGLLGSVEVPPEGRRPQPRRVQHPSRRISVRKQGAEAVEMVYGFPLPRYDLRWEVLRVLLGNYPTSLTWRDEFADHTYIVDSGLEWTSTGGGFFLYFGATSARGAEQVDRSLQEFLAGLDAAPGKLDAARKIRCTEILKMKEGGEAGLRAFLRINPFLAGGGFDQVIQEIQQADGQGLLSLAREHLKPHSAVRAVVGPEELSF